MRLVAGRRAGTPLQQDPHSAGTGTRGPLRGSPGRNRASSIYDDTPLQQIDALTLPRASLTCNWGV